MRRALGWVTVSVVLMLSSGLVTAAAAPTRAHQRTATDVVASYFGVLNSMLAGTSADGLASVYTTDAVLAISTPKGTTKIIRGLPALEIWYTAWAKTNAGSRFVRTSIINPLPGMVVSYDYTGSAARPLIGRCAHVFSVSLGKIVTDDWLVYFVAK